MQDVIGSGVCGFLYRALDMRFPKARRLVAVKELNKPDPDFFSKEDFVKNFEREVFILASLNHPAIPKIFDFFSENNRFFMVLEYIEGNNLQNILKVWDGFIPVQQVLKWAIEICETLIYIHNRRPDPFISSHLKPSNILINSSNHIVLTGIGITNAIRKTKRKVVDGTEVYYPYELYHGKASSSADIYDFGVTLYSLLTGRDPQLDFPSSFYERLAAIVKREVPEELVAIIGKMVASEPEERYKSAEEIRYALLRCIENYDFLGEQVKAQKALGSSIKAKIKTKTRTWSFSSGDEIRGTPTPHNSNLYIGSYDQFLYALNGSDGSLIWKYQSSGGIVGQPLVKDNIVYIGSEDSNLYALSSRTGRFLWKYKTQGPVRSSPKTVEDHVLIGSDSGYLHAINLVTAQNTWKTHLGSAIRSSPLISREGLYVGTESGEVFCLDLGGKVKWKFYAKNAVTSTPASWKDLILFPSLDASFYAVSRNSGWLQWSIRMGKGSVSSPFVIEDTVLFGSADGFLYAVDLVTLKIIWKFNSGAQISGSPVCSGEKVYFGNAAGKMICLALQDGNVQWEYQTTHSITGAPVVNNDMIYFGSADNKVHALSLA